MSGSCATLKIWFWKVWEPPSGPPRCLADSLLQSPHKIRESPAGRFWVLHGSPAGVDKASSCFDAQSVSAQNSKPIASAVSSNRCKRYLIGKHIPFSSSPLRRSNEQLPDFYQDELRVKVLTRILRSRFGPMTTTKSRESTGQFRLCYRHTCSVLCLCNRSLLPVRYS